MSDTEETVTISKVQYELLMADSKWLTALENAGVDNWGGIAFAYELMEEES